jgi:hypothetical protein
MVHVNAREPCGLSSRGALRVLDCREEIAHREMRTVRSDMTRRSSEATDRDLGLVESDGVEFRFAERAEVIVLEDVGFESERDDLCSGGSLRILETRSDALCRLGEFDLQAAADSGK